MVYIINMLDINFWHILLSEIKNKKVFYAMKDTQCELCFDIIFEESEFYFMGDKEKICQSCMESLIDLVEKQTKGDKNAKSITNN